jgi:hypothetical protein
VSSLSLVLDSRDNEEGADTSTWCIDTSEVNCYFPKITQVEPVKVLDVHRGYERWTVDDGSVAGVASLREEFGDAWDPDDMMI